MKDALREKEAPEMMPEVKHMLENPGLYAGGDAKTPNVLVPLVSTGGKVFSLMLDSELDPLRFLPTATFNGPYKQKDAR